MAASSTLNIAQANNRATLKQFHDISPYRTLSTLFCRKAVGSFLHCVFLYFCKCGIFILDIVL